ncbi:ankyrin repeat domain-containing protein [Tahibacter harae]|uniref:Ankyrin repeat domain-containing protein n=1 Tax=Tahibacter harae TaxID=2963937 RepID=A0ABT1QRL7_9GAMM|nr:ankyrin repeat domain-containing protein [Tahibacter harae]MCQ4164940.1 ankyrin repeat domain-containing protein [Tahibacter harae]
MKLQRNLLALALGCALAGAALARQPPGPAQLIERAEAQVEQGTADPQRDLEPLLRNLRAVRDESARHSLISAIEKLGDADGASPAAVKAWFAEQAPPVLLDVARSQAGWSLRGDALMALRTLDASDVVLDEAIAIARADTSEQKGYIRSRGALLEDWKDSRRRSGRSSAAARPADAAKEQQALELLRTRSVGVSADSLSDAVGKSRPDVVSALLDAGVDVNAPGPAGMSLLTVGAMIACSNKNPVERQLDVLDILFRRGAQVNARDAQGNTVLMAAVQSCPLPVIEKFVAGGAEPDPVNAQQFTPLKMALIGGHWDIADFLVGKGARITAGEADQLFFEKPQDPAQLAVLKRAIKPGQ